MRNSATSIYTLIQKNFVVALITCALFLPLSATAQSGGPISQEIEWISNDGRLSRSIAWGDVDGDGDLDLAAGTGTQNTLFLNNDGELSNEPDWVSDDSLLSYNIAWGDVNGDGDLDLAVGNDGANKIYLNNNGQLDSIAYWTSTDTILTNSIAWGDIDGNGDLDLVAGNDGVNTIYFNNGGQLSEVPVGISNEISQTLSVALGDIDGDGDLDLAAGNNGRNAIYLNENNQLNPTPIWASEEITPTLSLTWGDLDGDGDLDLAAGNDGNDHVYLNIGGRLADEPVWTALVNDPNVSTTHSIAWADIEGDGDLDLVTGNSGPIRIFVNQSGRLNSNPIWVIADDGTVYDVAWGDVDGDHDLDLVIAHSKSSQSLSQNKLYINESTHMPSRPNWLSDDGVKTYAVAWGDVDGDGDLDLAAGGDESNALYINNDGRLDDEPIYWNSTHISWTTSIAWGDVNQDGMLDLAEGNGVDPIQVYLNSGSSLSSAPWVANDNRRTRSIAWGDVDGDGDLDLAAGNEFRSDGSSDGRNTLYINENGLLNPEPYWLSDDASNTQSVAWGDVDGDGDLDLATGNLGKNGLYINEGGKLSLLPVWTDSDEYNTYSIAWGDMNGDGHLDLAVGNSSQPNVVYLNEDGRLSTQPNWIAHDIRFTKSIVWGDMDGDGDLDLVSGNSRANSYYRNEKGWLNPTPHWYDDEWEITTSISLGDMDGDGDLDIASGNFRQERTENGETVVVETGQNSVSTNQNLQYALSLNNPPTIESIGLNPTSQSNLLHAGSLITQVQIPITYTLYSPQSNRTPSVTAEFSLDGGDNWRPAVTTTETVTINLATNETASFAVLDSPQQIPNNGDSLTSELAIADDYTIADIDVWLAITHTNYAELAVSLMAPDGTEVEFFNEGDITGQDLTDFHFSIRETTPITNTTPPFIGAYRPVGELKSLHQPYSSGTWSLVVTNGNGSGTGDLESWGVHLSTPSPKHVYYWDTFESGFFGQSDNVVVRMTAQPQPPAPSATVANSVRYTNTVAGPYQRASVAEMSSPFSVRGTQVRVNREAGTAENVIADAIVYRLPSNQTSDALPLTNSQEETFRTNIQGYLSGRGEISIGDKLIALAPGVQKEKYTVYHTSAPIVGSEPILYEVTDSGVQDLTVSHQNALAIFDLSVSLEWDARNDQIYLNQLEFDIQRTSQLLYDWTNGQAALGEITIYHAKEKWEEADIHIHATNDLRPHATIGGIVSVGLYKEILVDGEITPILYTSGHVEMGAVWNRYGEAGDSLSEDWARTLTHELGHYLFFLFDNYIGIDGNHVSRVEGCPGVMSDPYSEVDSEFHPEFEWAQNCTQTLSHQLLGRSDWETIVDFYEWFSAPAGSISNPAFAGPNTLPLAVTQVRYVEPESDATTVDVNTFFLLGPDGSPYVAGNNAKAFLFKGQQHDSIVNLGAPRRDRVQARHASLGDTLCVYELTATSDPVAGCTEIANGDTEMSLSAVSTWQPDVIIEPVSRSQINVSVGNLPADPPLSLKARLYPANMLAGDVASAAVSLQQQAGSYNAIIDLTQITQEAYLHIYDENNPAHVIVADYTIGGAPVLSLDDGDIITFGGGDAVTFSDGSTITLSPGDTLSFSGGSASIMLGDGETLSFSSGSTLSFSSGGTIQLDDNSTLSFSSGSTLSFSSGGVVITQIDGPTLSFSSGGSLLFDAAGTLEYTRQGSLILGDGDTLSFSSGNILITQVDGTTLSFSSNSTLSFSSGGTIQLGDGSTLSFSSGSTLSFSSGGVVITQPDGSTLSFNNGSTVTLVNGSTLSFSSGGTLSFSSGGTLSFSSGGASIVHDGSTLSFSSGSTLLFKSGSTLSFSSGNTLALSENDTLSFSSGNVKLVGAGDTLSYSSGSAPISSANGQVTIYVDQSTLGSEEFYTIQPATVITAAPAWTTPVGQAYRVTSSLNVPNLEQASISINYLGRNIADDKEKLLHIYFWDGTQWSEEETEIDEYHNRAVADLQGAGIYALMYSIDIPLANTGWNLFAYPLSQPTPVLDAFASIDGLYSTVYGYDAFEADQFERWALYDPTSPAWVNDLNELTPSRGYWININDTDTATVTLKLRDISSASVTAASSTTASSIPAVPPATYYGQISAQDALILSAGISVQAWVGDLLCGQGQTKEVDGQIVYVVTVYAKGSSSIEGCEASGDTIRFTLDGQALPASNAVWNSERVHEHNLTVRNDSSREQYLPFVSQ